MQAPAAPLTQDEIREVQTLLKARAFDPGPIDGFNGPLTVAAIKKYEAANLRTQTGHLDRALLEAMRRESSKSEK